VENVAGSVTVQGWDQDLLRVTGALGDRVEELQVRGSEDRVEIEVEIPRHAHGPIDANLQIQLPRSCRVELETVSAAVVVEDVTGELVVESVSGGVRINGPGGEVSVESVSGAVSITGNRDQVQVATISGPIQLVGVRGTVETASVSGGITIDGAGITRLEAESTNGKVLVSGGLVRAPRLDVESLNGTVEIHLPADFDATVSVSTFSGTIRNAFGQKARRCSKFAPGEELEFSRGSGAGRIRIECFNGTVRLERE
jgi:DUF4097 and DUF4098 domain-containing protein YvlB